MNAELNQLLRATSRSFYLTLRVLPRAIRTQIGLAYLLARTTDTIADTEILSVEQRLAALQKLRERILGQTSTPLDFGELAKHQGLPAECALLEKTEDSLAQLRALTPADLKLLRAVLVTITSGQEFDLLRFGNANPSAAALPPAHSRGEGAGVKPGLPARIIALETAAELDHYTYCVAGCVGEFWTRMCRAHLFPNARMDDQQLIADGIRFGKGLQLVNILRDLPADLKNGRCYLPRQQLAAARLEQESMLSPASEAAFLPLFRELLDLAESHLAAGWHYTNTLPFGQFRLRLACAWPILIGGRTIEKLRKAGVMDLQQRVKVSRGEVRGILGHSIMACPWPFWWRKLYVPTAKAIASNGELA